MTLKYDKNGVVLSLYPYEYASKVLNGNETFTDLDGKIKTHRNELPEVNDVIQKYVDPGTDE